MVIVLCGCHQLKAEKVVAYTVVQLVGKPCAFLLDAVELCADSLEFDFATAVARPYVERDCAYRQDRGYDCENGVATCFCCFQMENPGSDDPLDQG